MARYPQNMTAKCFIRVNDEKILWYKVDEDRKVIWCLSPEETEFYKQKMLANTGEYMSRYIANHPDSALWEKTN